MSTYNPSQENLQALTNWLNEKTFVKCTLWQKNDKVRIYIKAGYNTNKVSQDLFLDCTNFELSAFTKSNQPYAWNKAENEKLIEKFAKYARAARLYFSK